MRRTSANCARRSSGIASRCALYASKIATRACGTPLSKQATTCVGFSSAINFVSVVVKTYAASMRTPRDVVSGRSFIAKKAA